MRQNEADFNSVGLPVLGTPGSDGWIGGCGVSHRGQRQWNLRGRWRVCCRTVIICKMRWSPPPCCKSNWVCCCCCRRGRFSIGHSGQSPAGPFHDEQLKHLAFSWTMFGTTFKNREPHSHSLPCCSRQIRFGVR
jgi:hypothetical protein